jgi:DNA-binding transcriptional ArsR family regulator
LIAKLQLVVAYSPETCNHVLADIDDDLWSAIGDPSRRRVLDLLVHGGDATPSKLAAEVPFSRQAVSKHLSVLEHVGLIESRRSGREVHYRLRLDEATRAMAGVARDWDRRLSIIKRLAEAAYQLAQDAE